MALQREFNTKKYGLDINVPKAYCKIMWLRYDGGAMWYEVFTYASQAASQALEEPLERREYMLPFEKAADGNWMACCYEHLATQEGYEAAVCA